MSQDQFGTVLLAALVMSFRVVSMGLGGYILVKFNVTTLSYLLGHRQGIHWSTGKSNSLLLNALSHLREIDFYFFNR